MPPCAISSSRVPLSTSALVHHDDPVRLLDGAQTMRDQQHRLVAAQSFERPVQQRFGLHVDLRGRLVQHHDRRILQQGPGDGESLRLPAAQRHALVADHGVQTAGVDFDEVEQLGRLQRRQQLVVGGVLLRHAQVVGNRAVEQERVLRHQRNLLADPFHRQLLLRHTVEQDLCRTADPGYATSGWSPWSCREPLLPISATVSFGSILRLRSLHCRLFGARIGEAHVAKLDADGPAVRTARCRRRRGCAPAPSRSGTR